ncbi:hypothetical protein Tsubulata_021634 [Turnera subulata]|uniref:Uncharacterized protein n=1 Tax=Turnera subulata TaxID=218843 RepID=A0A9Q0GB28_9ROSI|nr:hypothetical protein Tsubulata_021634 [Turnera subulata]
MSTSRERDTEKFKKYESDYAQYLKAKYFSTKNIFGDEIFESTVKIGDGVIKSSRSECTQSYVDPVKAVEDRRDAILSFTIGQSSNLPTKKRTPRWSYN